MDGSNWALVVFVFGPTLSEAFWSMVFIVKTYATRPHVTTTINNTRLIRRKVFAIGLNGLLIDKLFMAILCKPRLLLDQY